MLRKRTRSLQKDQHNMGRLKISDTNSDYYSQSHLLGHDIKINSICNTRSLFVGLCPISLLDSDSVRSPTSPLELNTVPPNLGNPFRTPKLSSPSHERQQKSWDCSKVGLSILDSLEDSQFSGKILRSSESNKISLCPQMMIKSPNCILYLDSFEPSKSLPKNFCKLPYSHNEFIFNKGESNVIFEIGETLPENESFGKTTRSCSLDSYCPLQDLSGLTCSNTDLDSANFAVKDMTFQASSPPHFSGRNQNSNISIATELNSNSVSLCSSNEFIKSLSATEIEFSEDYTCIISHGPNPRTTHIFCDCILETTHSSDFKNNYKNDEKKDEGVSHVVNKLQTPNQYLSGDFLSFCYHCNNKLKEGEDIYMYRGEKAFCSLACRAAEIMIDEELEKSNPSSDNSLKPEFGGKLLETGILKTT